MKWKGTAKVRGLCEWRGICVGNKQALSWRIPLEYFHHAFQSAPGAEDGQNVHDN